MERTIFSTISYSRLFSVQAGVLSMFKTWLKRIQDRRALSELEPHMLKDIGLEGWQVRELAAKPFWRA